MERKSIEKAIMIIWLIGLIFLWVSYPFMPGDIFFWMYVAIIWSIAGGVVALILYLTREK